MPLQPTAPPAPACPPPQAEKEAERQRQLEEERRRAEEAAAAAAAEEAAAAEAKKQRQAEKKALQRERARLRRLCGTAGEAGGGAGEAGLPPGAVDAEDVEQLCGSLGLEDLQQLCEQLSSLGLGADAKQAAVAAQLRAVADAAAAESAQKEAAAAAAAASLKDQQKKERQQIKAKLSEWSEEEVRWPPSGCVFSPAPCPRRPACCTTFTAQGGSAPCCPRAGRRPHAPAMRRRGPRQARMLRMGAGQAPTTRPPPPPPAGAHAAQGAGQVPAGHLQAVGGGAGVRAHPLGRGDPGHGQARPQSGWAGAQGYHKPWR